MASNRLARRLVLLNLALLMGLGPFIIIASARNSLRSSPSELETSSLADQQGTEIEVEMSPEHVRIDAFDMKICGKANFRQWQKEQSAFGCIGQSAERAHVAPRILQGEFANDEEFPSFVYFNLTLNHMRTGIKLRTLRCGATLIHRNLAVTAAHCLVRLKPFIEAHPKWRIKNITLIFGSNQLEGTGGEVRKVERWCYLKNFTHSARGLFNDLAVIRFKGDIEYTSKISPACLNLDSRPSNGTICAFAGAGSTIFNVSSPSDRLKTLSVRRSCQEVGQDQSCYMTANDGLQVTQTGDSGSPVFCYDQCGPESGDRVRAFAVGANSWGNDSNINDLVNHVADFHQLKPGFLELLQAIRLEGNESLANTKCSVPFWRN